MAKHNRNKQGAPTAQLFRGVMMEQQNFLF